MQARVTDASGGLTPRAFAASVQSRFSLGADVADAPDGLDERRASGVDLLAYQADEVLDDAGFAVEVVAPDVVEKLVLRNHAPRVDQQVAQNLELRGGQLNLFTVTFHAVRVGVEGQVVVAEYAVVDVLSGLAETVEVTSAFVTVSV